MGELFHLSSCLFWAAPQITSNWPLILPACLYSPALLRFLAQQSSIARMPAACFRAIQDGWVELVVWGIWVSEMAPPSLAGGLRGIWNRIPISCAFVWTRLDQREVRGNVGGDQNSRVSICHSHPTPLSDLKTTFKLLRSNTRLFTSHKGTLCLCGR